MDQELMRYIGAQTDARLSEGEEWKVPVDAHGVSRAFSTWETEWQEKEQIPVTIRDLELMEQAWNAAIEHFATLRRIGWIDQKGRVWTKIPPSADFDGGSLTPLLIDARD